MKKLIFFLFLISHSNLFSQAKQPNLIVMPSDIYCNRHGYTIEVEDQGRTKIVSDYDKLFKNDENMRQVISKINEMIIQRGYTKVEVLESTLRGLTETNAEMNAIQSKTSGSNIKESPLDIIMKRAKPDIRIDIDFDIKKSGASQYIHFNIQGIDAYINTSVASASGDGNPAFSVTPGKLIEEAVLSHIDNFLQLLQAHFDEMFINGRYVKYVFLVFEDKGFDLETEFNYKGSETELSEIIENWFVENSYKGRFETEGGVTENKMIIKSRIPLYDQNQRPLDAGDFIKGFRNLMKNTPFNIINKKIDRGLGEIWLILGEK